jgi:hypothetical protein
MPPTLSITWSHSSFRCPSHRRHWSLSILDNQRRLFLNNNTFFLYRCVIYFLNLNFLLRNHLLIFFAVATIFISRRRKKIIIFWLSFILICTNH